MDSERVILGIDPGTQLLGFGIIRSAGKKAEYVDMGVLDIRKEKDPYAKLRAIYDCISEVCKSYSPTELAIESPFYGKNEKNKALEAMNIIGKDIYEAYIRSAGHTVKMSREQVHELIAQSHGLTFEDRVAMNVNSADDVLRLLDYSKFFEMLHKNIPSDTPRIITQLNEYGLIATKGETYEILNLGAILFARELRDFNSLRGKEIIVRRYEGTNNRVLNIEYVCNSGYAVGFESLIDFIAKNTSVERIEVLRSNEPSYPIVAVRELLANMMVHQDFAIKGMLSTVEIFTNRIAFTNPGSSLNDVNRLIDLPPHSRNEKMAQLMLLLDMCERRGSGIDRATDAIGQMKLPAYKAQSGDDFTRITLFPKKNVKDMTREERIAACYQHACLLYEDGQSINNMSVRERFNLNKNQTVLASRILSDTQQAGLIKPVNPEMDAKRYYAYIPYYG